MCLQVPQDTREHASAVNLLCNSPWQFYSAHKQLHSMAASQL